MACISNHVVIVSKVHVCIPYHCVYVHVSVYARFGVCVHMYVRVCSCTCMSVQLAVKICKVKGILTLKFSSTHKQCSLLFLFFQRRHSKSFKGCCHGYRRPGAESSS